MGRVWKFLLRGVLCIVFLRYCFLDASVIDGLKSWFEDESRRLHSLGENAAHFWNLIYYFYV